MTEACCFPGGDCVDLPHEECLNNNGISRGPGTSCHLPGDLNGDGVADLSDWDLFVECMDGPDNATRPECAMADINCDGVVDLRDVRIFQLSFGR